MYYGLALGTGEIDLSYTGPSISSTSRMPGFNLALGYEVSPYLSLEGRLVRQDHDFTTNMANAYLRLGYPTARTTTYLMVGAGAIEAYGQNAAGNRVDLHDMVDASGEELYSEASTAAVLGIELFGNDTTALTMEYMANFSEDYRVDMYALGYRYYFGGGYKR